MITILSPSTSKKINLEKIMSKLDILKKNVILVHMSNKEKNDDIDHMKKGDHYVENGKLMVHGHEVGGLALVMGDITKNQGRMIGLFALLLSLIHISEPTRPY